MEMHKELQERDNYINLLKGRLAEHESNQANLAEQLINYRNELREAQYVYYKFDVLKIRRLLNVEISIVLKRDSQGKYIIEFQ